MRALAYAGIRQFLGLAWMLCAAQALGQSNVLNNPSFDEPALSEPPECDQAAGWQRWGSWANRHLDQPDWKTRNGPAVAAYHHWQSDSTNAGWYQDVTNLTAGAYCRFSVWAEWEPACNASNIELRIEPLGGGPPYRAEVYTSEDIRSSWTYITVQSRLPKDATAARIVICCTHGFGGSIPAARGTIKFDDADLVELSSP